MHPTGHHRRRVRSSDTHCAGSPELLRYERVFVRDEVCERWRTCCACHAFVFHAVLQGVGYAIERSQKLARPTAGVTGSSLVEYVRIQDWNGVETWSTAVISKDSQQMFRDKLNARD